MLPESLQVIGQLGYTYILCQAEEGLHIVDQHAAHERVVYETLKQGIDSARLEVQALLFPRKLEMTLAEGRMLLEKREEFGRFGIELDHFGGNTFLLRSVPVLLEHVEWETFLSEFLAEVVKYVD